MCINTCLLPLLHASAEAMESVVKLLKYVVARRRSRYHMGLQDYVDFEVSDLEYAIRKVEVLEARYRELLVQHRTLKAHHEELERRLQRGIAMLSNPEPPSDQNKEKSEDHK